MLRIAGITIPDKKRLEIGLTAIYGVGRPRAEATLKELGIDPGTVPEKLAKDEAALREAIEKNIVEGELRRFISGNIRRLKDIKAHRGIRHMKKLPVRGQTSKTTTHRPRQRSQNDDERPS